MRIAKAPVAITAATMSARCAQIQSWTSSRCRATTTPATSTKAYDVMSRVSQNGALDACAIPACTATEKIWRQYMS